MAAGQGGWGIGVRVAGVLGSGWLQVRVAGVLGSGWLQVRVAEVSRFDRVGKGKT